MSHNGLVSEGDEQLLCGQIKALAVWCASKPDTARVITLFIKPISV